MKVNLPKTINDQPETRRFGKDITNLSKNVGNIAKKPTSQNNDYDIGNLKLPSIKQPQEFKDAIYDYHVDIIEYLQLSTKKTI